MLLFMYLPLLSHKFYLILIKLIDVSLTIVWLDDSLSECNHYQAVHRSFAKQRHTKANTKILNIRKTGVLGHTLIDSQVNHTPLI